MSSRRRPPRRKPEPAHACPHPEAVGKRWGDPISEERQAELKGLLDRWAAETDHGGRKGPFDKASRQDMLVPRTGADVFWLAQNVRTLSGAGPARYVDGINVSGVEPRLHLEGMNLAGAHLEEAFLDGVRVEGANLIGAHLEGAFPPTAPPTRRARRGSLAAFRQQRRAQEGRWTRRATATPSTPSAPSPS